MNHQKPVEEEHRSRLQIWYCEQCGCVHLRTTNVCLDFTEKEFNALMMAMIEIHEREFLPRRATGGHFPENKKDEVLESEIIT